MSAPRFWMYETSGALSDAVSAYLNQVEMTPGQIDLFRDYLAEWIRCDVWAGDVTDLRARVGTLATKDEFARWLAEALDKGIDPL